MMALLHMMPHIMPKFIGLAQAMLNAWKHWCDLSTAVQPSTVSYCQSICDTAQPRKSSQCFCGIRF